MEKPVGSLCKSGLVVGAPAVASPGMIERLQRASWLVFLLFALLGFLFGVFPGTWFADDIERDSQWLVATYAAVAVALTVVVALTAYRRGERWAWWVFWIWPAFFLVHGLVFFYGDLALAALGVGTLLLSRPRTVGSLS